jgi:hypothetical protein
MPAMTPPHQTNEGPATKVRQTPARAKNLQFAKPQVKETVQ